MEERLYLEPTEGESEALGLHGDSQRGVVADVHAAKSKLSLH